MKITDKIKGGLADSVPDGKFNLVSLLKGIKVEMEHTSDKSIAKEIAKDHLSEDPLYYDKIKTLNLESILREDYDNSVDVSKYKSYIINVETNYTRYYRKFPKDIHLQNKIKLQFSKLNKIATKGEWENVSETVYTEKHDFVIRFRKNNDSLIYIPYFENKIGEGLNRFETVFRVLYNGDWYQFEDGDKCLEMVEYILSGKTKKEKETTKPTKKGADIIQSLLRVIRFHLKEDRDIKSLYNIAIRATQEGDEESIKGLIKTLSNKLSQKPDVQIEIPKKGKYQYVEQILQYLLNKHK